MENPAAADDDDDEGGWGRDTVEGNLMRRFHRLGMVALCYSYNKGLEAFLEEFWRHWTQLRSHVGDRSQ